jgi:hypothetical protein
MADACESPPAQPVPPTPAPAPVALYSHQRATKYKSTSALSTVIPSTVQHVLQLWSPSQASVWFQSNWMMSTAM